MKKSIVLFVTLTAILVMAAGLLRAAVPDNLTATLSPKVKAHTIIKKEIVKAKADGDTRRLAALESEQSRLQGEINRLAGRKVTEAEIVELATKMGYFGAPDKWAQKDVDMAVSSGKMVGRGPDRNASENAWKQPAKREELAIVANRLDAEAQQKVLRHNYADDAHPAIQNRLTAVEGRVTQVESWQTTAMDILKWAGIVIGAILALLLLIALLRWIFRPRNNGFPLLAPIPGAPNAGGNAGGAAPWWPARDDL